MTTAPRPLRSDRGKDRSAPGGPPRPINGATNLVDPASRANDAVLRIENLPKEAGWMLITAGVVGLVVPGILGTPFLLAGGFIVAPGGPKLLSRWIGNNPRNKFASAAMRQVSRFLDDFERRYPRRPNLLR